MEVLKKKRVPQRAIFTKLMKCMEDELNKDLPDTNMLKGIFLTLTEKISTLRLLDENILDLYYSETEVIADSVIEAEIEGTDKYINSFNIMKTKIENLVQTDISSDVSSNNSKVDEDNKRRRFKLPPINIKTFSGDISEWLTFWNQFERVHLDDSIDNCDKYQILYQCTAPKSRAREIVESFPQTSVNYLKVVDCLKTRFGKEDTQIEYYVRELLMLIIQNSTDVTKIPLSSLYDKLECKLRALDTLGVKTKECEAMLFPLIESCVPAEILRAWKRNTRIEVDHKNDVSKSRVRLDSLMQFIRSEVESEQDISMAIAGFKLGKDNKLKQIVKHNTPTAAGLHSTQAYITKCIFCEGSHSSNDCPTASTMPIEEKKKIVSKRGVCFICLKKGHLSKDCRVKVKCKICERKHSTSMCQHNLNLSQPVIEKPKEVSLSNQTKCTIFLQTLSVLVKGTNNEERKVRVLIDSGSHRSYICQNVAQEVNLEPVGSEDLVHALFGGSESKPITHTIYKVRILSLNRKFACNFRALDQNIITNHVPYIPKGAWSNELADKGIVLTDTSDGPIDILMGADIIGKIFTGEQHYLKSGLVAINTLLGWTLIGKVPSSCSATIVNSCLNISDIWSLDVLGIADPAEVKCKQDRELEVQEFFKETVRLTGGRYEVRLPWIKEHPPLPTNFELALKRVQYTVKKLKNEGYYCKYKDVLNEWLEEGVIELIENDDRNIGHYLPHRHVIKLNSASLPLRPVFDASAKEKNSPSLNDCLEKGINLIELIPPLILRFRMFEIGVMADIRRAFLQINIAITERDFLKFLWIDEAGNLITYRHNRVVFGLTSSPFLLAAVIRHHIDFIRQKSIQGDYCYSIPIIDKLVKGFYVDNYITSITSEWELPQFIEQTQEIMKLGGFDLRQWEYSRTESNSLTPLLGLMWDKFNDRILFNSDNFLKPIKEEVSKRVILSVAQQVFDPLGIIAPVSLIPKLLIQQIWAKKTSWDEPVEDKIKEKFINWLNELPLCKEVYVSRWIKITGKGELLSLHTFCDASGSAYACVVFLRVESQDGVSIHFLQAKNRVAPLKSITIPRLELLAATIGARLGTSILKTLQENYSQEIDVHFWTDSSTVLAWIRKCEQWGVFVQNRIREIKELTTDYYWHHVPSRHNPADLPSRGCTLKQLMQSKWWNGPEWLLDHPSTWALSQEVIYNEKEIMEERRKSTLIGVSTSKTFFLERLSYFSSYNTTVRMLSWCLRFIKNSRSLVNRETGFLKVAELARAEIILLKMAQKESFDGVNDKNIKSLVPFLDDEGVIRLKTKVSQKDDNFDFRFPILMPANHPIVDRLVMEEHKRLCHAATQTVLCSLRERFWIVHGRKTVKSILRKCVVCRRYDSKNLETAPVALPNNRVREASAFEITGIDLAGPLYLKNGEKHYICLFTCAIYRAVHLELLSSLTTATFIKALKRFIARRGRPTTIYTDNGTNFVGANNLMRGLDWSKISCDRIKWIFTIPSTPWWGGWWERLIGMLKRLLRRVLGRSCLNYEEMLTVLCECEAVLNSRPLTYLSNSAGDLTPLTPDMFVRDLHVSGMPDLEKIDDAYLNRKLRRRAVISKELRQRFRREYLGLLRQPVKKSEKRMVKVGDVVIISSDHSKRMDWPLAIIEELIEGKDGEVRVVRLRTASGSVVRPFQRIHPLEIKSVDQIIDEAPTTEPSPIVPNQERTTRSGRTIKLPPRFLS